MSDGPKPRAVVRLELHRHIGLSLQPHFLHTKLRKDVTRAAFLAALLQARAFFICTQHAVTGP